MPLTEREKWYLDPNNAHNPKAQGFRMGAEAEARMRREAIPDHLRELFETVEVMCEVHADYSPEQIAATIYFIFHTPTRWERLKRRISNGRF